MLNRRISSSGFGFNSWKYRDGLSGFDSTFGIRDIGNVGYNPTNSTIIVVGSYGTITTSTDEGATWSAPKKISYYAYDYSYDYSYNYLYDYMARKPKVIPFQKGFKIAFAREILSSSDGVNWSTISSPAGESIVDMAWSGNNHVIVTRVFDSATQIQTYSVYSGLSSFTKINSIPSSFTPRCVTWDGAKFILAGIERAVNGSVSGKIYTSPDGINWTIRPNQISNITTPFKVLWNGSKIVVISPIAISISSDGSNWNTSSFTGSPEWTANGNSIRDICWDGSKFLIVGSYSYATSQDGLNWTIGSESSIIGSGTPIEAIRIKFANRVQNCCSFGTNKFIVAGGSGYVYTSKNNINSWTLNESISKRSSVFGIREMGRNSVASDGTNFVAISNNTIATSNNGIDWTKRNNLSISAYEDNDEYGYFWNSHNSIGSIVRGNNQYLVFNPGNFKTATSSDGINWIERTGLVSYKDDNVFQQYDIIWNGTLYMISGVRTALFDIYYFSSTSTYIPFVAISYDGITWTNVTNNIQIDNTLNQHIHTNKCCWTGTHFVLIHRNVIYYSVDAINWTKHPKSETFLGVLSFIYSISGNASQVLVGTLGKIITIENITNHSSNYSVHEFQSITFPGYTRYFIPSIITYDKIRSRYFIIDSNIGFIDTTILQSIDGVKFGEKIVIDHDNYKSTETDSYLGLSSYKTIKGLIPSNSKLLAYGNGGTIYTAE